MQRVTETGKCLLTWGHDGIVSKQLIPGMAVDDEVRSRFEYEGRVSSLFITDPPPVAFPRLVETENAATVMRFVAVDGEPYGPKYPTALSHQQIEAMLGLCEELPEYRPAAEWLRRFEPLRELSDRLAEGVIEDEEFKIVSEVVRSREWPTSFAHGDMTPRNVLSSDSGPVLIDWEFAGWYPVEYDRAFLWMVLVKLPGHRDLVEETVSSLRRASFWMSAYFVQLMHLGMWKRRGDQVPSWGRHRATQDLCLSKLLQEI